MNDPLADVISRIGVETFGIDAGPITLDQWAAAFRANRDRLLEALGGTRRGSEGSGGLYGAHWTSNDVWLFPLGEDQ